MTDPQPQVTCRRILCIDGGGILGTFPAACLAALESHLPNPLGSYFDLIAGTSTGGIIAIGLGLGHPASELLDLYEKRGPEIFDQKRGRLASAVVRKLRSARRIFAAKYHPGALRSVLDEVLGERRIGDAQTRLLIPAWNPVARTVHVYKTAHHPRIRTDYRCLAVDAAMATAAAPTYFPRHVTHDAGLTDGGTWANNPIALAVVEAIAVLGWPARSLHVLSLGCLEETYGIAKYAGIGALATNVIRLFMDGQSHGAMGIAKLLTGHEHEREAIHRIDHVVPRNRYRMDDARVIPDLTGLGHAMARDRLPALESVFFRSPADAFVPFHPLEALTPPPFPRTEKGDPHDH